MSNLKLSLITWNHLAGGHPAVHKFGPFTFYHRKYGMVRWILIVQIQRWSLGRKTHYLRLSMRRKRDVR
jgi:hypothetical protein